MIDILFSLNNPSLQLTGFELGHIDMVFENGKVSSRNRSPDQSMMIFITIVDLLDGLKELMLNKKNKEFTLIGADSSFMIQFNRLKNHQIGVYADNKTTCEINEADLAFSIYNACISFCEKYQNQLSNENCVEEDIKSALGDFKERILNLEAIK